MNLTFDTYQLSNGITLIVKENHHTSSVVVRGYLCGGANLDRPEQAGLASLTGSAMRRGTTHRTFAEINETVEAVAASVYVNSGRHLTSFGGKSLAEDFDLLVELMADNLLHPTFPAEEIEKLRGQIITSLKEDEDDTQSMAQRHFRGILYTSAHPYGRSVDGTLETLPDLTRADVVAAYQRLHPKDGAIVVVGDVTGDKVYQTIEQALGTWQPSHAPPETALPDPQPVTGIRRHVWPMPNKSQADIILGWIGVPRHTADFYPAYVGNTILGQLGLGGRIGHSVRETAGMAYYARSSLRSGLGPSPWMAYAGVNPDGVDKAVELMLAEIRRLCEEPVTDQELDDAQAYLTGILPLQMETNEGVASRLLDTHLYALGNDFIGRYPEIIRSVTKADIQAVAQKYLDDEVYALSIAGPSSA